MALSIDWVGKLVLSTSSITDIVAFETEIRDFESSQIGMLSPAIVTYKRLNLGGGAFFHGVDFINGWQLKFPTPGNYEIIGNIGATVVPVAGVFIERTKAAAFATVAGGAGGGLTQADVRAALQPELNNMALIPALL